MKQKEAHEVLKQGYNVLLTGSAGSGKTYLLELFIKSARENGKKVAVTASTGLAAANINGTTIHNWSGIGAHNGQELNTPNTLNGIANHMFPRYRQAILIADILIIDEISMLHDYQLEAINKIVCGVRNNDNPFGGLQVLLCGDFFQLPPIGDHWRFITEAEAYRNGGFKVCFLDEYYRHNEDDELTDILKAIRANNLDPDLLNILNNRIDAQLLVLPVTRLCSMNQTAATINQDELNQLPTAERQYPWKTDGDENELLELQQMCRNKVAENLVLKEGTVVIFTKNDPDGKFFNGTIGKVIGFEGNWPNVQLSDKIHDREIVPGDILNGIRPADFWSQDGDGNRLATIKQIPLMLAWAITIHKSQGMTLDNACIDISGVWGNFGPGLGYVALSRVRRLQDISLAHEIPPIALTVNPDAIGFENDFIEQSRETYRNYIQQQPTKTGGAEGVKFITTQSISHHIDELIRMADEYIVIVTPYIKLNRLIKERLHEKIQEGIEIVFICKGDELREPLANYATTIKSKTNLHAKCYLSETAAIVTSMNLYEFSQANNEEMGIYIENIAGNTLYHEIAAEVQRLKRYSTDITKRIGNGT